MNNTLIKISPEEISPNPHNPRLVFDPESMEDLKKSIYKVGILVPLTVFRNSKSIPKTKYILLDGERRWRCAKELLMSEVPVNVIDEPSDVTQNILYMFNIHHYRKEWTLFPTALKLEALFEELGTDSEKAISDFTGVSRSTIRRCKMLLWMPYKYRELLMQKSGRISTDFFIELYPIAYRLRQEIDFDEQSLMNFIDKMIEIFENRNVVQDVKDLREIRKSMGYYDKTNQFYKFMELLDRFIKDEKTDLTVFTSQEFNNDTTRNNTIKYISYLNKELQLMNPDFMSDYYFVDQLNLLKEAIEQFIEKLD